MTVPDLRAPAILWELPDMLVCWKPGGMATAPLRGNMEGTLLEWAGHRFPEVLHIPGRSPGEGGLAHRLDTATSGLVVIARSPEALHRLLDIASVGGFRKEYVARCTERTTQGGPPDLDQEWPFLGCLREHRQTGSVTTAFRPYGPGRRRVAPVVTQANHNQPYTTDIFSLEPRGAQYPQAYIAHVALTRGFRHQVRVHLAAMGLPIDGDLLYGGVERKSLQLLAAAVVITDSHGADNPQEYRIEPATVEAFLDFS